ncbi:MAG TPA: PAS domain-containing protein, partial [Phycisphaerae bacterium]|nr:PAS domain-containing protein [Phycisphaerae bacterium]
MGAYVCRISPAILAKYTANPERYQNGNIILLNQYDQVICSSLHQDWRDSNIRIFEDEITDMVSTDAAFKGNPEKQERLARNLAGRLEGEIQRTGEKTSTFSVKGYYVFIQPLKDVPWRFVYVLPAKSVWLAAMGIQEYFFLPLIMVALLLVFIVPHMVFRKYFVKPMIEMVRFMRTSAFHTNAAVPNVPDAWKPWFQEISQLPHLQNIAHSMPGALFQVKLSNDNDEQGHGELGFISESITAMLDERIESILENLRADVLHYFDETERENLRHESRRIQRYGGNLDMQCRLVTVQGRVRWVRIMATPRVDENGETILEGILLDYTEQNETAKIVQEQQSILQMLTEAAIEGIFINNEETIIQANQALADMFGYSRVEDILGRNINDFMAPESYGTVQEKIKANFTGFYEVKCMRRNGEIFDAEIHVRQTQFGGKKLRAGAIKDISHRKNYELDMKRRDRILESVTQMAEMFITDTDFTNIFDRCFPSLGEAVEVNRITIYRKDETLDQLVLCPEYTWATSKLEKAHALSLPNIVVPRDGGPIKRWIDKISLGETVYGSSGDFIASEKALLSSYGLRSVAIIPVFVDSEWWGCMMFGVSDRDR